MNLWASLKLLWIFYVAASSRITFQSAGNSILTYSNGPGYECKRNVEKTGNIYQAGVVCSTRWSKNQTERSNRSALANKRGCLYYRKSNVYHCYGTDRGNAGPPTCVRTVSRFMITPLCGGSWLDWTLCDKTCGGGTTTRFKFIRIQNAVGNSTPLYEKITERMPCNVQACPKWGPWERGRTVNGTVSECNTTTCTRIWERTCIYNNTVTSPSLCHDGVTTKGSLEYGNFTRQERRCQALECEDATSVIPQTDAKVTTATEVTYTSEYDYTEENATNSTSGSGFIAQAPIYGVAAAMPDGDTSLGFLIGFVSAVALCLAMALFVYKRVLQKKIEGYHERSRVSTMLMSQCGRGAGSFHSHQRAKSGTVESACYLQPNKSLPPSALPLLQARQILSTVQTEGPYHTAAQNEATCAQIQDAHCLSRSDWSSTNCVGTAAAGSLKSDHEVEPLYSDIPAYTQAESACGGYSSSEFESTSGESDEAMAVIQPLSSGTEKEPSSIPTSFESKDDRCKSFESDESRDVVRTLRKPSKKLKVKRSSTSVSDHGDVFLSEEEMLKEELDDERKSAFSVRYTKILSKKSRSSRKSLSRKGSNQPVEAGFQWIEGRRWTNSTNSDCSLHNQTTPLVNTAMDNYGGRRRPTLQHRHSSGTNSAASFNLDTSTSGYNSAAFGDSTDDEYWAWSSKTRLASRHSLRDRGFSRRKIRGHDSQQSLKMNSLFNADMLDLRPRQSTSLFDPRVSRFNDSAHVIMPTRSALAIAPFRTARPRQQRNLSLLSRSGQVISVEDVYSFPIDAAAAKESPCSVYDLPYDARNTKSVVS